MAYTPPIGSDAILTFLGSYSAPLGDEATLSFGEDISVLLYQIWTDENFVYAVTNRGLDIYDIPSEEKYAYITYSGGFNTVWANDTYVFVGTSNSGIKYLSKTCVSGSISFPIDLFTCLNDFSDLTYYCPGTSNSIYYLHGNGDKVLCITESGVDVFKLAPYDYRSYTLISGAKKGFMTSSGKFYYTVSGTSNWSIDRVNTCLADWYVPNYSYITGSGILASGISINDIFVTENTSYDGIANTLFVATSSGVYVVDESSLNYAVYYKE